MKIVVISGLSLFGSKVVNELRNWGYEVMQLILRNCVNTITGEGKMF